MTGDVTTGVMPVCIILVWVLASSGFKSVEVSPATKWKLKVTGALALIATGFVFTYSGYGKPLLLVLKGSDSSHIEYSATGRCVIKGNTCSTNALFDGDNFDIILHEALVISFQLSFRLDFLSYNFNDYGIIVKM